MSVTVLVVIPLKLESNVDIALLWMERSNGKILAVAKVLLLLGLATLYMTC